MCLIPEVATACPQSCGFCCEDANTFEFKLKNKDTIQNCARILRNDKKTTKRINSYSYNNRTIRDACPLSCDFCFSTITAKPASVPTGTPVTPVPTKAPTPAVTAFPTLTLRPSTAPSRPPSPQPSPFPSAVASEKPSRPPSPQPPPLSFFCSQWIS